MEPVYLETCRSGRLKDKIAAARRLLSPCRLCPRQCGADRLSETADRGICKTGASAWVSSGNAHFGEEAPLVGSRGSGTVFFTHCNLMCLFCQNFDISHQGRGREVSSRQLADIMLALQADGCHNINLVTPSHVVPQILEALETAVADGLNIPLVYNSGGYDSVETLEILDGVVDIYMPDFKFWDAEIADAACQAPEYPQIARSALKEMHRQVGELTVDASGIARRGLLLRHLVLPEGLAGTREIMRFTAENISADTYVNIMPQYRPCGRAGEIKGLDRCPTRSEFRAALAAAEEEGITRMDQRRRVFLIV